MIQNKKPLNSVIKCDKIINNSEVFVYSSCKILSSGNFNIYILNHSYYKTPLVVSAGIKKVLTITNKNIMALGELFEVQPNILGEDNIIIAGEPEIEIMNSELIGLKKIICRYQNCKFYVSCLEVKIFNISYKISYSKIISEVFSSNIIECQNPVDEFIKFNEIENKVRNI